MSQLSGSQVELGNQKTDEKSVGRASVPAAGARCAPYINLGTRKMLGRPNEPPSKQIIININL